MKTILLLFFTFLQIFAQNLHLEKHYSISYGVLGELGIATASVTIDNSNKYTIKMEAKTTGLAKFLSQNKQETYLSRGTIIDNKFVPDFYSKQVTNNVKHRLKEYQFDHQNKKIIESKITKTLDKTTKKWAEDRSSEPLEYYASNDILSLFFNLKEIVKNLSSDIEHTFYAVGANKDDGKVNVEILAKNDLKVFINQKIFSSPRGELYITLDKDGLCDKATLKDVLLFGDVRAVSLD